ncbi:hypothetical protein [Eleftheria terrae]|uniref:hypothetical protein n=1 Tax=Eleftheria terrae TaxID=1597781 RepID=UPI00263B9CF7|nr:hypothetical protein [Eleftheria terrae]WKB52908.1 hypothetical protein N7L95_00455 [Eleftheria terrae]
MQVDIIWPGVLAPNLLDLSPFRKGNAQRHFPGGVASATVRKHLLAMPWLTDTGCFAPTAICCKSMSCRLPSPVTRDERATAGKKIQQAERAAGNQRLRVP